MNTQLRAIALALVSLASVSQSQEPAKPPAERPDAVTLPAIREMTDSAGRKMQVTILSKNPESVKIRRTSDGKEFELPLN